MLVGCHIASGIVISVSSLSYSYGASRLIGLNPLYFINYNWIFGVMWPSCGSICFDTEWFY